MEKYYHSIQDWHKFADSVTDLVEEYIKYSSDINENDGLYVDESDNVSLENRDEVSDKENFHPISQLIIREDGMVEVDFEKVEELTDKYIFVR